MNWDAFAQQVAGGIQRGASGWAGTIRSDIERKKNKADSIEIIKLNQAHDEKMQRENQAWDTQKMLLGAGISNIVAKRNAEMEQNIRREDAEYKAKIESVMGDKQLGMMWAADNFMGNPARAKAQYDLMNRVKSGAVPGKDDGAILASFPPVALGNLKAAIKENQDRLLARKRDFAYIDYMNSNNQRLQDKKEWTIQEVMTALEDNLVKQTGVQKSIDAIMGDPGFQAVNAEVARLKYRTNEEFQAKNPSLYARYMSYASQLNRWSELLDPIVALGKAYKSKLDSFTPAPPEPTDADKKAFAEEEARRKAASSEPRGSLLPGKSGPDTSTYAGRMAAKESGGKNIFTSIGDLAESMATEKFKQVEVADMFHIDDPSGIFVLKNRGDYRDILSGNKRLAPGSYLFDPWKKDLFQVLDDGMLMEIPHPKVPAKKKTLNQTFGERF